MTNPNPRPDQTQNHAAPSYSPRILVDIRQIAARIEVLDTAPLCGACRTAVTPAAADAVTMLVEVIRLHHALTDTRLTAANHLAAIRAALAADMDGEPDPLAYLRDHLAAEAADTAAAEPPDRR